MAVGALAANDVMWWFNAFLNAGRASHRRWYASGIGNSAMRFVCPGVLRTVVMRRSAAVN